MQREIAAKTLLRFVPLLAVSVAAALAAISATSLSACGGIAASRNGDHSDGAASTRDGSSGADGNGSSGGMIDGAGSGGGDDGAGGSAMCPVGGPPSSGSSCSFAGEGCDYDDAGVCGVVCSCSDDGGLKWACSALPCPPPPCDPGGACSPGSQCTYYPCSDCNPACCDCTTSSTWVCLQGSCPQNDAGAD